MTNLTKRVAVAAVGIPLAVGVVFLGGWFFTVAITLIALQALREFYHLAESKHASPNQTVGLVWLLAIMLEVGLQMIGEGEWGILGVASAVGLLLMAGTITTLSFELFRARENAILNTSLTAFGVLYIGLCMTPLIVLRNVSRADLQGTWGEAGAALVLTLFVSVWLADTGAYFVGMSIGKHKLFPRVSPKKSWEGAIGGLVASTLAFWGMGAWLLPGIDAATAIICGVAVGIVGPVGDLAESLLKRDAVVKDSSGILPGHGGLFDRFDSMLFAAPVVFIILYASKIIAILGVR